MLWDGLLFIYINSVPTERGYRTMVKDNAMNQLREIAERIKEMREILGLSAEEMAEKTEVSVDNYKKYESAQADMPFTFIHKCALTFGIDMSDLLEGRSARLSSYTVTRNGQGQERAKEDGIEIDNLTDEEVKAYADDLTSKYEMMSDVEYDKFIGCVKATLAIKKLAEKNDVDCFVYNDIDQATFRTAGCRAGFYPQWFNENVSVLVPEADIGAGPATYVLKLLTGKNVNFIEPFHIDGPEDNFAAGHAGPNDYTHPRGRTKISRDVRFAKTESRTGMYLAVEFFRDLVKVGETVQTETRFDQPDRYYADRVMQALRIVTCDGRDYLALLKEQGSSSKVSFLDGDWNEVSVMPMDFGPDALVLYNLGGEAIGEVVPEFTAEGTVIYRSFTNESRKVARLLVSPADGGNVLVIRPLNCLRGQLEYPY